jgi:hypothetical protein
MHSSRFIASGQPARQEEQKGQEDILILSSCIAAQQRFSAVLYPPLSDWIVSSNFIWKKWAHFRLQKTPEGIRKFAISPKFSAKG